MSQESPESKKPVGFVPRVASLVNQSHNTTLLTSINEEGNTHRTAAVKAKRDRLNEGRERRIYDPLTDAVVGRDSPGLVYDLSAVSLGNPS